MAITMARLGKSDELDDGEALSEEGHGHHHGAPWQK
jgi:hypothetical protein